MSSSEHSEVCNDHQHDASIDLTSVALTPPWSCVDRTRQVRPAWRNLVTQSDWGFWEPHCPNLRNRHEAWLERLKVLAEIRDVRESRYLTDLTGPLKGTKRDNKSHNYKAVRLRKTKYRMSPQAGEKPARGKNKKPHPAEEAQKRRQRLQDLKVFETEYQKGEIPVYYEKWIKHYTRIKDPTDAEDDLFGRWEARIADFESHCEDTPASPDDLVSDEEPNVSDEEEPCVSDSEAAQSHTILSELASSTPPQTTPPQEDAEGSFLKRLLDSVANLNTCGVLESEGTDEWISVLEGIVILAYQVTKARTFTDVFVAFMAYIKSRMKKSLTKHILATIDELSKTVTPQSLESNVRDVAANWNLMKTNTIFKQVSYLMSAAMSITACEQQKIEWNPMGLKLVSIEASKEQVSAVDVCDALIKTFQWFVTTGNRCIASKSMVPILFSDAATQEFNQEVSYLLAHSDAAINGTLGPINSYENRLDAALLTICQMKIAAADSPVLKLWCQKIYGDLVTVKQRVIARHKNTQIRFAPIGWHVSGPSGVGKSTLQKIIMSTSLNAMKFEFHSNLIANMDCEDQFDSTYTSDCTGATMDDVGNGRPEFTKVSPSNKIIKFWNNMAAPAVKAELNAKGTTFIEFACGVTTSNFKDMNIRHYSDKPESILRRFHHVRVQVKPEYQKDGGTMLDTSHPDLLGKVDILKDVWLLTIEECHIYSTKMGQESYYFRTLKMPTPNGDVLCENLNLDQFLKVVVSLSERHKQVQEGVVQRSKDFDSITFCKECKMPGRTCTCPKEPVKPVPPVKPEGLESHQPPPKGFSIGKANLQRIKFPPVDKRCWLNVGSHVAPMPAKNLDHQISNFFQRRPCSLPISQHPVKGFCGIVPGSPPRFRWQMDYSLKLIPADIDPCKKTAQEGAEILTAASTLVSMKNNIQPHSLEAVGDFVVDATKKSVKKAAMSYFGPWIDVGWWLGFAPIRWFTTKGLSDEMSYIIRETTDPILARITPDVIWNSGPFQYMLKMWQLQSVNRRTKWYRRGLFYGSIASVALSYWNCKRKPYFPDVVTYSSLGLVKTVSENPHILTFLDKFLLSNKWYIFGGVLGGVNIGRQMYNIERVRTCRRMIAELEASRELPKYEIMKLMAVKDSTAELVGAATASVLLLLKVISWWNQSRIENGDVMANGAETSWFGLMMTKIGLKTTTTEKSKGMNTQHLVETFTKNNLFFADFSRPDGTQGHCNIVFPRKGVAMFPEHLFYTGGNMTTTRCAGMEVTVKRSDKPGGTFTFRVDETNSYSVPNKDLIVCVVPNCPDLRDKTSMFPLELPTGSGHCKFLTHVQTKGLLNTSLSKKTERVMASFGNTHHMYRKFYGGEYQSTLIGDGTCMGLLISETKNPCIVGMHIGGNTSGKGVCQSVTKSDIEKSIEELRNKGHIIHANAGPVPTTQYGKQVIASEVIHPHAMASRLENTDFVDVLGSTHLRSQMKSSVVKSVISDEVEKSCGVPSIWGPPRLRPNWKCYNATMEHFKNPALMFPPRAVEKAMDDYSKPLLETIPQLQPLSDQEAILGRPGVKHLDALPMNTSMGFPVFGKKEKHFTEVRDGQVLKDRIPSAAIIAEKERLLACYKNGERGYPVCNASLKDEPTPVDKDKVRVFYACPVALSLLIRKYFLPVTAWLSNQMESECAVGTNPFSRQWSKIWRHATKFDKSEMIAWDYSKYDIRMNSQITVATLRILIHLARKAGYCESDLSIMEAMVSDIVHPLVDYNGTMLMLFNINTSGNNITVIINSIAGSLYVRLGFFDCYPNETDFRSKVAALTYGDDFVGTVHPEYRLFNFSSYKNFLAKVNMKITLPDKSSDEIPFMKTEDVDFLKRKNTYIPELECNVGRLDEASIFKSLHSNLSSRTVTKDEVSISCIETAMHEWFFHGKETYEKRQNQMKEVCQSKNWTIPAVLNSFEERVEFWRQIYDT